MTGNACRHFLGMHFGSRPSCAKGRDVRAWAIRCNGGDNLGIGLRLPCTRRDPSAAAPLFDCPELDRRTDDEVAQREADARAAIALVLSAMPKLYEMKAKMIANGLSTAKATCPWCGEKDALRASVALGVNNHMHARCTKCNEGFME